VAGSDGFEDDGVDEPLRPSRPRRLLQVAIVVVLIVSMVFLAFVSGRGVLNLRPLSAPDPTVPAAPTGGTAAAFPARPGATRPAVGRDGRHGWPS
jgi:hypothetical protein